MKVRIKKSIIELVQGDITTLGIAAIVNAANTSLKLGGGVAGAIAEKGGPKIQEQCDRIGGTYVGGAVITTGGNLKAKHVIHAVGPVHGTEHEDEKLKNATLNSLKLADKYNLKSIAFPAISTGIFGFPKDRCAIIMLSATIAYLEGPTKIERVVFCLYSPNTFQIFRDVLEALTAYR
ncbi:MAG: macro domain-containing protein [Candidatus Bathyarchaeota archaeon]|nr:MAG: macro domain-containing protein [Candidatus Bathyarchaeota archaeon]